MLVVQKFGGTSVGTPKRIHKVAERIAARHSAGDRVVVVVSAMGQTTDRLHALAADITPHPSRREMDMLLTAGERISMALLSMALDTRDIPAISFTGSQSGIITDTEHTRARILAVKPIRIGPELDKGKVVIVAGFQGVSPEKEITTLGRGGSDTTAVALAAGLGADQCEIFTDVPGVMSADPRSVPQGRILPRLHWDTMLELSCCGAGVMHSRAVALARKRRIPFQVRSTFRRGEGTVINGEPLEAGGAVVSVTGRPHVAEIHMRNLRFDSGDALAVFFNALEQSLEDVVGLHQYGSPQGVHVSFHIPVVPEGQELMDRLRDLAAQHKGDVAVETSHASVSVVASGMLDATEVVARSHKALAAAAISPASVLSGNMSVTFLVPRPAFTDAQQALHREFVEGV